MATKAELRRQYRRFCCNLSAHERTSRSERIAQHLVESDYTSGVCVAGLFAGDKSLGEPHTEPLLGLLSAQGIRCAYPKVSGHSLQFFYVNSIADLAIGYRGILEPSPDLTRVEVQEIDLLLVPGLAFTVRGARLGRGGGYYDRLIASLGPHTTTIGVAFAEQLADEVPLQPHDQFVAMVLTDRGWIVP